MTPTQLRVLDAIRSYHAEHRVVPTIRGLAALLGFSFGNVHRHLEALIDQGELVRIGGKGSWRNYALPPTPGAAELTDQELLDEIKRRGGLFAMLAMEEGRHDWR